MAVDRSSRRSFITQLATGAVGGVAATAIGESLRQASAAEPPEVPHIENRICVFTDHLDDYGYSYQEIAGMLKQLGVAGPDLTVRNGGVVPPAKVIEELPKAVAVFREHELDVPMVTTELTSAADPTAKPLISTLGKLGIRYYKVGYYRYDNPDQWPQRVEAARKDLSSLVELGREAGVQAGFQNHSGPLVGSAIFDLVELLAPLDPQWVGCFFDPAHATIEGGKFGWQMAFRRLAPRLKMLALKDFVWERVGGSWQTRWCPLGEGLVQWPEFFRLLARTSFAGPVSLHIEYDPGGAIKAARYENSLAAAARDVAFLRKQMREAFGPPPAKN